MQKEKIATVALVIIIVGALSVYLINVYYPEVFENIFDGEKPIYTIETGDLADVHYIGRFAANDTIFDSSYVDPENKSGGSPAQVFLTLNTSELPPEDYSTYSNIIGEDFVEGFIEGLLGLQTNQVATMDPIPPEKAYGVSPQLGDVLNLSSLGAGDVELIVVEITENAPMPPEFIDYLGPGDTTIYVLRDQSHYVGEEITPDNITTFGVWDNSTVVTKINETLIWMYTTPPQDKYDNLNWVEIDIENQYQLTFPENSSAITSINDTTIVVTHTPEINETIELLAFGVSEYIVESLTEDKIVTYLKEDNQTENKTYLEFNRTKIIERNQTQNITFPFPSEYLELILSYLRGVDTSIKLSTGPRADQTVYFEVHIVEVYRPS